MSENVIDNLKEALKHSPDNIPLRFLLADAFLADNRLDEAEGEFSALLKTASSDNAKFGLANAHFKKANYSICSVILEDLIQQGASDAKVFALHAKTLLKENNMEKAIEAYRKVLSIDPDFSDAELDDKLRLKDFDDMLEMEDEPGGKFLQKPKINFSDAGGMETVKKEIEMKIIKPLQHPELYKAYGKKIGGGILLYGPPGCGKTFIAKATAGETKAKFISVSLNDILDMWIGNSEKNLHEIFELARANTPCVFFVDEIDALGASRSDMKQSSGRHLINQFLQELDGISSENEGVLIIGATNTPWNLDGAFRRPGRFDRIIFVPPPDAAARQSILKLKLKGKPAGDIDLEAIAKKTEGCSGADIDAIIDIAIEQKLENSFKDGFPKPIETKDLLAALKKHKPSTQEWFATAKNYALFANEAGLYDDVLAFLRIKK